MSLHEIKQDALKVGHIVEFRVIKALPDYDEYTVVLVDNGIKAHLPKIYAFKEYTINETGWAAIFDINGFRVTLSQLSPQYIRKTLEFLLSPLIQGNKLKVKRVAKVVVSNFCKVTIQSYNNESGKDIAMMCMPYLKNIRDYINRKVVFIKYSNKIEEYVVNALYPASQNAVIKIERLKEIKKIRLYVEERCVGRFLGKKGANVTTAAKLTSFEIEIIGV